MLFVVTVDVARSRKIGRGRHRYPKTKHVGEISPLSCRCPSDPHLSRVQLSRWAVRCCLAGVRYRTPNKKQKYRTRLIFSFWRRCVPLYLKYKGSCISSIFDNISLPFLLPFCVFGVPYCDGCCSPQVGFPVLRPRGGQSRHRRDGEQQHARHEPEIHANLGAGSVGACVLPRREPACEDR